MDDVPATMQAAVLYAHGGPEQLVLAEVPVPEAGPDETLVRVRASGVEPGLDAKTRQNGGAWPLAMPHVLGASSAGEVVVSNGAGALAAGARVVVHPVLTCGECRFCRSGRTNSCLRRGFMGTHRWGGYAEYVTAPTRNLIELGDSTTFSAAASAATSFGTAWQLVATRAGVGEGDVVLIVGASGSVGVAAAQIARRYGAQVILAGRDAAKLAPLASSVGALGIIDSAQPFAPQVAALTDDGVDLVFETVGAATWAESIAILNPEGRIVCCGGSSGNEVTMQLRDLYRTGMAMHFSSGATREELALVMELIDRRELTPMVARTYPLAEAARAHAALAQQEHLGKIVISQEPT